MCERETSEKIDDKQTKKSGKRERERERERERGGEKEGKRRGGGGGIFFFSHFSHVLCFGLSSFVLFFAVHVCCWLFL